MCIYATMDIMCVCNLFNVVGLCPYICHCSGLESLCKKKKSSLKIIILYNIFRERYLPKITSLTYSGEGKR